MTARGIKVVREHLAKHPAPSTIAARRAQYDRAERVFKTPPDVRIEAVTAPSVPAEWLVPPGARTDAAVLYLHGGGYVIGSPRSHRHVAAAIAAAAGVAALLPDYRLAPEHPFPAAYDDAFTAWGWLRKQGIAANRIAVGGDSAGGGLTLALAMRLREEGLTVLGFGEKKTPEAFRNACHKFVFTELLRPGAAAESVGLPPRVEAEQKPISPQTTTEPTEPKLEFPKQFVLTALEQSIDDAGWAHLGTFGSYLTKLQPDFDSRLYGYKKLSDLVKAKTDLFVTEERQAPGSNQKVLYLHAK
jgi:hypothetical protein